MNHSLNTLFTGQNLIEKDIVGSTNSEAAALLAEMRPAEGTAILARQQTSGRGQQGTSWESAYGENILASFIFYPSFLSTKTVFFLNITFSLALHDFAKKLLHHDVALKWPNDLYYKDKKLAGLLIENSIRNNEFNHCVVGIGMNVNQTAFHSDAPNPASLKSILNSEQDMMKTFNLLCECIEARYLQLKSLKLSTLKQDYMQSLYRLNTFSTYAANGKTFIAKIVNVSDEGMLELEDDNGQARNYNFKEVSFV